MAFAGKIILKILKKAFNDRVVFKDNSYIEYLHREGIIYVEKSRRLEIVWFFNSGTTMKGRLLPLDINFKNWDPPHDRVQISENKSLEILEKIKAYCKKRKIPIEIE